MLLSGCTYHRPLLPPETDLRPKVVGYGAHFSVRIYSAEIADYRFMGAVPGPDGSWLVRIDPVYLGIWNQPAQVAARPGDILPLGPTPSVLVQFEAINTSQLVLKAVGIQTPRAQY